MVKKAVLMIAIATPIVNVNVNQTLDAPLFSISVTPSRGTKIKAVSLDINASDQMPAMTARNFVKIVRVKLQLFNLSDSSGKPSDSKLTSIFRDKYCSVNYTGCTVSNWTSFTSVSHLAFLRLYKKNLSLRVFLKVAIVLSSTFYCVTLALKYFETNIFYPSRSFFGISSTKVSKNTAFSPVR